MAKKTPKKAKKAKEAKTASAGQVESASSPGHASNPQTWAGTTMRDAAAQAGSPFYEVGRTVGEGALAGAELLQRTAAIISP